MGSSVMGLLPVRVPPAGRVPPACPGRRPAAPALRRPARRAGQTLRAARRRVNRYGRRPVQHRAPGGTVARGLLGLQGAVEPDLLPALAGPGRGPRAHPRARPRGAGGQPPVLLRLLLPAPGAPPAADVRGQGRVLRRLEDGVVLPGGRADPDGPGWWRRLPARARHGHPGASLGPPARHLPGGDESARPPPPPRPYRGGPPGARLRRAADP